MLKKIAPKRGIEVVTASAPSSADVLSATRSLVGKVDAIYVTTDNTLMSAFESVAKVGMDADIPVFGGDTSVVERGAVAAAGFNYYDIGRQTGKIIARVFEGEDAGSIPVQFVDKTLLHVNLKAAKEMGVTLPESFVDKAEKVIR
jgi:putative ABC transport system substrate-binding protein